MQRIVWPASPDRPSTAVTQSRGRQVLDSSLHRLPTDHLGSTGTGSNSHISSSNSSFDSRIASHSSHVVGDGLAAVGPFPEGLSIVWPADGRKRDAQLIISGNESPREFSKPQVSERGDGMREMRKLPLKSASRWSSSPLRVVLAMIRALEEVLITINKQQVGQLLHVAVCPLLGRNREAPRTVLCVTGL